ncbi:sensor histidine kinase [Pseudoxanthomonas sacheonensis]|uniref:histidine kinase n=1 Tax=Pseudoxanthomonas sacheonensis TaxID=443615 RepID=A0ABU1RW25_9GAMM|nr:HAMP domain-containing sensor histidine kinase [Pseudoxanthomonas sacheonensis]MDR6842120.1 signal transduction histidine kinase [Pseudoxanthomonas sacheonensis]
MGKLFWKICLGLWFGSALLMVGTALLFAMTIERRIPEGVADSLERFGTAAARAVLAAHESGSRRDTSELLNDLERFHGLRMYFLDKNGKDILERQVPSIPPSLRSSRERASDPSGNPQESASNRSLTIPMSTKAGGRYQAVIIFSRPPGPPLDFLLKRLLLPVIVSIFLAGVVSAVAARYLVNPISKLQSAAQRLARGEMDYRIGAALTSRKDEFTALGEDFDRMADQIGRLLASQRQLMLDLSHELRSPLARIKVALELARRQESPDELIDRMDRDADRMDALIGELLLLARLESPDPPANDQSLDLSELIASIVEDAQLESSNSGHFVRTLIAPGLTTVGDRELLTRAIENVLRNALKHTPNGGDIELEASRNGEGILIKVLDSGKGVPEHLIEQLFTPFTHGEGARAGFGLGLAITRAAIIRHGGTVAIRNRSSRSGLEVRLHLPDKAAD